MHHPLSVLQQAGYRLTAARRSILDILARHRTPLSVQDIHAKTRGECDLVSVYRTMELFTDLGIVQAEHAVEGQRFCLAGERHHHIQCRRCGRTEQLVCDHAFPRIHGFRDVEHELRLSGICRSCSKEIAKNTITS